MTDISKNWLDLSVNSNILKPTYINGFIDVSNNILGREKLWIENQKDIGDTRLGLGTVDPSCMIDIMSNNPKIRFTNTSINAATQNDSNLGTINIMSPSNNNSITSSIICQNIDTDYDDNGSLILTTDSDNDSNIEGKDKMILTSNGDMGVGLIPSIKLNPSRTTLIAGSDASRRSIVMGNISSNKIIGSGTMPIGGIAMWSGTMNDKSPQDINGVTHNNWKLCDGGTYNGINTPNIIDRFMVGAGNSYSVGNQSGAASVTLSINEIPGHTHTVGTAGNHEHSAIVGVMHSGYDNTPSAIGTDTNNYGTDTSEDPTDYNTWQHTHSISSFGGGKSHENRPSYYALAFVMRVE